MTPGLIYELERLHRARVGTSGALTSSYVRPVASATVTGSSSGHHGSSSSSVSASHSSSAGHRNSSTSSNNNSRYQSMPQMFQSFFSTPSAMSIGGGMSGSRGSSSTNYPLSSPAKSTYTPNPSSTWNPPSYGGSGGYSHQGPPIPPQIPRLSDMKFTTLPFFDEMSCILKPSNLIPSNPGTNSRGQFQEISFSFHLTVSQANSIANSRVLSPNLNPTAQNLGPKIDFGTQLLVRFALTSSCLSGSSGNSSVIEDCLPPQLCLKVNSKMCTLPPALPSLKTHPGHNFKTTRPVDITTLIKISPMGLNLDNCISTILPDPISTCFNFS